jgi:hypothetical protein
MILKLDKSKLNAKIKKRMETVQPILNQQVIKDSNYYAPKVRGDLQDSAIKGTDMNSTKIIWAIPYARRLYYGIDFNFTKTSNPNARAKWFEEAKAKKKDEWVKVANNAYNR